MAKPLETLSKEEIEANFIRNMFTEAQRTVNAPVISQASKKQQKEEQNEVWNIQSIDESENEIRSLLPDNEAEALNRWTMQLGRTQREFNHFKQQVLEQNQKKKIGVSSSATISTSNLFSPSASAKITPGWLHTTAKVAEDRRQFTNNKQLLNKLKSINATPPQSLSNKVISVGLVADELAIDEIPLGTRAYS